eukprot:gnl/TRDRNA2_/TRDRNA2_153618_c2_seq1.p1 gnl/TRDRNA2_/TRDRNA2_153618_c2~~gnl/TRDRNA2_/TRDRNA2_153618_c2_seq1.p1  ORF type:complete len:677 (+),score=89.80 gnl/TRDRNA2_/TRDRNA2_153618_c2_seq1:133-2031(+)
MCEDDDEVDDDVNDASLKRNLVIAHTHSLFNIIRVENTRKKRFLLSPQSTRRLIWDCWGLFLIMYDLVFIPMQLLGMDQSAAFEIMMWVTTITWTIDIPLNFVTGVYVKNKLVMRPEIIARYYMSTWLPLDIAVSAVDWTSLLMGFMSTSSQQASGDSFLRILRMVRFLRLLRLAKAERFVQSVQARINSNTFVLSLTIARLVLSIIVANHVIACLWYGVGIAQDDGWPHVTGIVDADLSYKYTTAAHWALSNFQASVEIYPVNAIERLFAISIGLIALILFSSFLSVITNLMMQLQQFRQKNTQRQRVVRNYLFSNNVSADISARVKKHIEGTSGGIHKEKEEEHKVLSELPTNLQMDLFREVRFPILAGNQFFSELIAEHPRAMRKVCFDCMEDYPVQQGDILFSSGEACSAMTILVRGELTYTRGRRRVSTDIRGRSKPVLPSDEFEAANRRASSVKTEVSKHAIAKGDFLSESVLWTPWEHAGRLVSTKFGSLLLIHQKKFSETMSHHETLQIDARLYASEYLAWLNACTDPSDLPIEMEQAEEEEEEEEAAPPPRHSMFSSATDTQGAAHKLWNQVLQRSDTMFSNHPNKPMLTKQQSRLQHRRVSAFNKGMVTDEEMAECEQEVNP